MFCQMLFNTYLVFRYIRLKAGSHSAVDLPPALAARLSRTGLPLWTAQFAFGFYSVMLTSTI